MKALIGTTNPGKIEGAKAALEVYFPEVEIEGFKADSHVSDQPVNRDTLEGARNRVKHTMEYAKENGIDADFYMAVESGIVEIYDTWYITNFAVVTSRDGYEATGIGPLLPVPDQYVKRIKEKGFGIVISKLFETEDLGKGVGGVHALTGNSISRIDVTREAFIMALTEHTKSFWNDKNKKLEKTS